GNGQVNGFRRVDDALRDHIHFQDAAENVHKDRFYILTSDQDFERFGHLLFGCAAANIEKVRRTAAVKLNDVHRRHREAGPVDETSDVAIEPDVIELVL